jgi:hypothetical protein
MKKRSSWVLAGSIVFVAMMAVLFLLMPNELGSSADGRVRFLTLKWHSGTFFSTSFGSRPEAWLRDLLVKVGFRNVQRTSFWMKSPPNSHFFILEYMGDIGKEEPNQVPAELIEKSGIIHPLIPVGGNRYGFQKRQFAYWVLNGVPEMDREGCQLKVYLPPEKPAILPVTK